MSTIEGRHRVGNGGRFVCGCLPFVNSTPAASERAATIFSPCPPARRQPPRPLSRTTAELLAKLGVKAVDFECDEGRRSRVEEAVMAQMIDALDATVEAERTKLLAELSQATEPRLSAIRKEIEACESLLGETCPIARRLI
jgi:hypothetical protein